MAIKIGAVGLGRLGYRHAHNLRFANPGVELVALCDSDTNRLREAADAWKVPHAYTDYDEMIAGGGLDAVAIVSPSHLHTQHIATALDYGLHVFCEKPLGTTLAECKAAEAAVARHPELVFMLGFMRRYDASYAYARQHVVDGTIGVPILFRGYSQDPESAIAGTLAYAGHSGGLFIDMAVHDIDLARWFMGADPVSILAAGGCYVHPEFGRHKDGDNAAAFMRLASGAMAFLFAGRTAPHGYNVETEIIGTRGILRIASVPQKNLVEILDEHGVRKECSQDFLERFGDAYLNEMREFIDCIRSGRKPEITVSDGTRCTEIALRCKESFERNEQLLLP